MTSLRRILLPAGLGGHRDWFGLTSGEAYDDVRIGLGTDYMELQTDSSATKIDTVVLPLLIGVPLIEGQELSLEDPGGNFGQCEVDIVAARYLDISANTSTYRERWAGFAVRKFFHQGKAKLWGVFRNDTTAELTTAPGGLHVESDWIYVHQRPWQEDLVAGDTLFWGREAFMVSQAEAYAGTGDINYRFKAYRTAFGTRWEYHDGSDSDDIEIFLDNPLSRTRGILVVDYDVNADSISRTWRGYLDTRRANDDKMSQFTLSIQGHEGAVNRQDITTNRARFFPPGNDEGVGRYSEFRTRRELPSTMAATAGDAILWIGVTQTRVDNISRSYRISSGRTRDLSFAIMGTQISAKLQKDSRDIGAIEECLVGQSDYTEFRFNFGSGDEASLHPFDVVRALLASHRGDTSNGTYDVLPEGWGLGMPDEYINHTEIDELKGGLTGPSFTWLYRDLSLDNLLIKAGDAKDIFDLVRRFLEPLMCFYTQDIEGKFTIRSFIDPGPGSHSFTIDEDDVEMQGLVYIGTEHRPVREITVKVSRRGNSDSYSGELKATDLRGTVQGRFGVMSRDMEVSALDYGTPGVVLSDWRGSASMRALQNLASIKYDMINAPVHYYRAMVTYQGVDMTPGASCLVTHRALYGDDGGRGVTSRRMLVMGEHPGGHREGLSTELYLMDVEPFTEAQHLIAPAWQVSSYDDPTNEVSFDLSFTADGHQEVGMEVMLTDANFEQYDVGDFVGINGVGTGTFTLDTDFLTTPTAGDIITLAIYDSSRPADQSEFAFIGDSFGEVGSTPDEAPKWGF